MTQLSKEQRRIQQMANSQAEIQLLEAQERELSNKVDDLKRDADAKGGDDFWANHHLSNARIELGIMQKKIAEAKHAASSAEVLPEELDAVMERLNI